MSTRAPYRWRSTLGFVALASAGLAVGLAVATYPHHAQAASRATCGTGICGSFTPAGGAAPLQVKVTVSRRNVVAVNARVKVTGFGPWGIAFGDGSTSSGRTVLPAGPTAVSHTYASPGTYQISAWVDLKMSTGITVASSTILGTVSVGGAAPPTSTTTVSRAAPLAVGVNDDLPKDGSQAKWFFSTMQSTGLSVDTLTLLWDETSPTAIQGAGAIEQAVAKSKGSGVAVELDLYPQHSMAFTGGSRCAPGSDPESCGDSARLQQFGAWAGAVAARFPTVHQFVVMNECNQPRFLNPQWDTSGANQSAEVCGRALVAAYDAIKAVNSANVVWGVGLSPRGNDNPTATSNSSTKPVTFLAALGTWWRAYVAKTGRTRPLMDGFDFHPYPVPQSLPFATGYADTKQASVTNLPRIYQAFYDAFRGTPQATIGQQPGGGLPMSLNEVGIQTDSSSHATAYTGVELSATSDGGVTGASATEAFQADWYRQMLDVVACDPNVSFVNIFHLLDEPTLESWQSGLYFADKAPKQSAQTVRDWLAATGGSCRGTLTSWTPSGGSGGPPTTTTTATTTTGGTTPITPTFRSACGAPLCLTAAPSSGTWPLFVVFTSSNATGQRIASWKLAFGDGKSQSGTGTPDAIPHVYSGFGKFTATLSAVVGGSTLTAGDTVTVQAPTAVTRTLSGPLKLPDVLVSVSPDAGTAPLAARFAIRLSGPTANIVGWQVQYDDNTSDGDDGSPPPALTHTYTVSDHYHPTVNVFVLNPTTKSLVTIEKSVSLIVTPKQPFRFALDADRYCMVQYAISKDVCWSGAAALPVLFTITFQSDTRAQSWQLDFGDGSKRLAGNGSPPRTPIKHTYAKNGNYWATAIVVVPTGRGGKATRASEKVPVGVHPAPVVVTSFPVSLTICHARRTCPISIGATWSRPVPTRAVVSFNEGSPRSRSYPLGTTSRFGTTVQHTWSDAGLFTAAVDLWFDDGWGYGYRNGGSVSLTLLTYPN